jgi:hypothetical protein
MTNRARRGSRAQRLARQRRRSRRRVLGATFATTVAGILVIVASTALAYWRVGGTGTGAGAVTSLASPTTVAGTASGNSVHVTWTGVTAPGAGTFGYYVQRFSSADGFSTPSIPAGTCSSSQGSLLPASPTTCDNTAVPAGTYKYRVVAVFRTWAASSTVSATVTVFALDHFLVSTSASAVAGTFLTVTVTAQNAANAAITNYTGTIHFTSSDSAATLPANYTFVPGDAGVHTFTGAVVLKTAGTQTVSSTDVAQSSATGTATVSVTSAALDHFVVTAPATATVGTAFTTATVAAKDAFGNPAAGWTSATNCVIFSGPANAPDGTAPVYPARGTCATGQSSLTFNASGVASGLSITLFDAQTTALTITAGTPTGTSSNVTVTAGSAIGLTFANATNNNGAVTVTCTGPIATLTCTASPDNKPGNNRFLTANIAVVDAYRNSAVNATGTSIVVQLTTTGGNSVNPVSVSIANGQTTSTSFTLTMKNGSAAQSVTASATGWTGATAQLSAS